MFKSKLQKSMINPWSAKATLTSTCAIAMSSKPISKLIASAGLVLYVCYCQIMKVFFPLNCRSSFLHKFFDNCLSRGTHSRKEHIVHLKSHLHSLFYFQFLLFFSFFLFIRLFSLFINMLVTITTNVIKNKNEGKKIFLYYFLFTSESTRKTNENSQNESKRRFLPMNIKRRFKPTNIKRRF